MKGHSIPYKTGTPLERFERYVIPEPMSGCYLWSGGQVPDGYGIFRWSTDTGIKAHRASWRLYRGEIPSGAHVLHRCDNRACVNPDHLFLGDNDANVADRVKKGRSARVCGPDNWNYRDGSSRLRGKLGVCRGERVHGAKLNEAKVRAIRADRRSQSKIASDYGIAQTLVSQVKRRKVWAHVD